MAKQFMRIKVIVIPFLTLAIMLSQLSGCAVVTQDDIVDAPSDVTVVIEDADLDTSETGDTSTDKSGTAGNTGVKDDTTGPSADKLASLEQQQNNSVLTTEELQELFELGYKTEKYGRENLDTDTYNYYCDMFPKRSTGTQADAIAYGFVELEVTHNSMYEGKALPSDGFEQYVSWREAQTTSSSTPSGNTGSSGSQSSQPSSGNNSGSNKGSGGSSSGSSGGNTSTGNDQQYGDVSGVGQVRTETPYYDWEAAGSLAQDWSGSDTSYGIRGSNP